MKKAMSGEGARGGKVIGHTKSGKPIYSKFNHPSHKNFTNQDHKDAADAHLESFDIMSEGAIKDHSSQVVLHNGASKSELDNLCDLIKAEKEDKDDPQHEKQEAMGERVEKEHSKTIKEIIADAKAGKLKPMKEYFEDIAEDHIEEVKDYYTRLKKMESEAKVKKSTVEKYLDDIIKAGEGSRGGKIIGHTKSGKPIYQHGNQKNSKGWSRKDHKDALDKHQEVRKEIDGQKIVLGQDLPKELYEADEKHQAAYKFHKDALRKMPMKGSFTSPASDQRAASIQMSELDEAYNLIKAGPGSRGGKIIGKTKSGQPIYDSHHKGWKGKKFSVGDEARMTGKYLKNTGQSVGGEGQSKWKIEGFHETIPDWAYTNEKKEDGEHRIINMNNLHKVGTPDHSNKSIEGHLDDLIKAGEGSKGGKVIGHTRSGKPVYASATSRQHKDFTAKDHADARGVHQMNLYVHEERHGRGSLSKEAMHHNEQKAKHAELEHLQSIREGGKGEVDHNAGFGPRHHKKMRKFLEKEHGHDYFAKKSEQGE